MNTKFLLSPAYLVSIALLLAGAVLSGGRFMLVGWILCILGVGLNAMTLVVLTNREQLYAMDARPAAAAVSRSVRHPWCSALSPPLKGLLRVPKSRVPRP